MEGIVLTTVTGILFTALSGLSVSLWGRISKLEENIRSTDSYILEIYSWARDLLDLYYQNRRPGAPDPDPLPKRQ